MGAAQRHPSGHCRLVSPPMWFSISESTSPKLDQQKLDPSAQLEHRSLRLISIAELIGFNVFNINLPFHSRYSAGNDARCSHILPPFWELCP